MEKLRNGKWREDMATTKEFNDTVSEIRAIVTKYNWQDEVVRLYSTVDRLGDLINSDGWRNFHMYTTSSKRILISEVNGLIDILNYWVGC